MIILFRTFHFPTERGHSVLISCVDEVAAPFNGFVELLGCVLCCLLELFRRLLRHVSGLITDIFGEIRDSTTSSSPRLRDLEQCCRSSDHAPR